MCLWIVDGYPDSASEARDQQGKGSYYKRRRPINSELDPNKTIAEQLDSLRVVDNKRYPAFFHWKDRKYHLYIS